MSTKPQGPSEKTIAIVVHEEVSAKDGMKLALRKKGMKRPLVERISMPDSSRDTGNPVHIERLIDRQNDRYSESVTDQATKAVIHECEEPLSSHTSHGSARKRRDKENP